MKTLLSFTMCATFAAAVFLHAADGPWEEFPDGSLGRVTEYRGVKDTPIAAYLRRPKGDGPFPVVVMLHGGGDSKAGTYALGRQTGAPTANFLAQAWAVYSIDFRPKAPFQPIEWEDACLAVETVRRMPFIDGRRVAMIGGSHGGYNSARIVSRCDLSCAIPCAAAAIDPIEVARAEKAGEAVNARAMEAIRRQAEAYGLTLEELIARPPANYNTPLTEVANVRCPLLLVSGRDDPASPPSVMETYARRLRDAGKEVELYLPDHGPHGFYFGRPLIPETDEVARLAVVFIAKHFGVSVRPIAKPAAGTRENPAPPPAAPAPSNSAPDGRAAQLFERLDTNRDGQISGGEAASESGKRFVGMFDKNRDGIVTRAEIDTRSPAAPSPPAVAAKAAKSAAVARVDTSNLVALTDLKGTYKGHDGGLYGGGSNEPPAAHRAAYLRESAKIQPLDKDGHPSSSGKIGLISIGFSNSSMEFVDFKQAADADPQKSPHVVIVNGSIGGRSAVMWAWDGADALPKAEQERLDRAMDLVQMPKANRKNSAGLDKDTWPTLAKRIEAAGLSRAQVQACWLKHVEARPKPFGEFPAHARALQADITAILNIARQHYANLRVVYLSSRTFGGWSGPDSGSPEPYAYESGFGTRWVVQSQIKGDARLNFDPARGAVKAPLVLWGPYIWAEGNTPRQLDGFVWSENDVRADRLHPSESGCRKTTEMLLKLFKTDAAAQRWFVNR